MKVKVDKDLCTLCMTCIDEVPDVFDAGEEVAIVKTPEVPPDLQQAVRDIAEECPAEAIIVEE